MRKLTLRSIWEHKRRLISTIVFAGRIDANTSPCARAASRHVEISRSSRRVRTTCSGAPPARAIAASMISIQRFVWAYTSPTCTVLPSCPSGAVPDTVMIGPMRAAREIPMRGSYGEPDEMS